MKNINFSLPKEKMITAKCILWSKEIDLSVMGANALDSHTKGKNIDIVKNSSAGLHCSFFRREEKPAGSTAEKDSKEICKNGKTVKGKLFIDYLLNDSMINVEILWTRKCVMEDFSFHSCTKISSLFSAIFKDSQIAAKMKFGKTKRSYFINCGLAPYIKEQLEKYISSSPLYVVLFDESMNSFFQNEQMDVAIRFWNNSKKQAET